MMNESGKKQLLINDPEYRREIIDAFVNSVYVYDDKLILTYNYKDGSQTLTLQEVEAALSSDLTGMCPPIEPLKTIRFQGFLFCGVFDFVSNVLVTAILLQLV